MATRRPGRVLTLAREWPEREALDLAFGNLGALVGRRSATGYDPMVPMRNRLALDGVSVGGLLPGAFFRSDPARLEAADVRWIQVPASALTTAPDRSGFGDDLEVHVDLEHPRFLPVPLVPATAVRIVSLMSDAVDVAQDQAVARVVMRLASGRGIELVMKAGRHTGEWAYDRPDVRGKVAHERPPLFESWTASDGHYEGHRYLGVLQLPGRYIVDGLLFERLAGGGRLTVTRVTLVDSVGGRTTPLALPSAFVSDTARFRETAVTPAVRLYELPGAAGHAHVVEELHVLPDAGAVLLRLRQGRFDPRREALAAAADVAGVTLPPAARASRAQVRRAEGGRLELQAEGPGLLVVAESWDPGWSAQVDEVPARILRLNGDQMGLLLSPGFHHVALAYRVPGLRLGVALAAVGALAIGALALQGRRI
jgi:hypothetical protein